VKNRQKYLDKKKPNQEYENIIKLENKIKSDSNAIKILRGFNKVIGKNDSYIYGYGTEQNNTPAQQNGEEDFKYLWD